MRRAAIIGAPAAQSGAARTMADVRNAPEQVVLILDDDPVVTAGLSAALARPGRAIVTCNDLESAEVVVERLRPSFVVSDVRLTGPFAFEGLDFIRFVKRHAPESRVILMTGQAPDAIEVEASLRGAVGFLQKPFELASLEALLGCGGSDEFEWSDAPAVVRVPMLDEILAGEALTAAFQPIVRLADATPAGFEALARLRTESLLRNPEVLFAYATRKLRVTDLERACVRSSIRAGAVLARTLPLFLNIHPAVFSAGALLRDALLAVAGEESFPPERIVLEITEQASLGDREMVFASVRMLKEAGVRFAFDDVGIAYSHLAFIDAVRPSFLKISQHFGTDFEKDPTKTKLVRNLLSLARDFDSELILEGIESESTARAAAELGIPYGQGYYFARPASAPEVAERYGLG